MEEQATAAVVPGLTSRVKRPWLMLCVGRLGHGALRMCRAPRLYLRRRAQGWLFEAAGRRLGTMPDGAVGRAGQCSRLALICRGHRSSRGRSRRAGGL